MKGVDLVCVFFDGRRSDVVLVFDAFAIDDALDKYGEYLNLDGVIAAGVGQAIF